MIVIDASALAKYLLREPDYDRVEQYLVTGVHSVDHLVKEVASAIRKHAVVYRKISVQDARELYRALLMLLEGGVVVLEAQEKYMRQAFDMALNYEITVYDALYIAQAKARSSKLLTSDRVQAVVAEKLGVEVLHV
ncbi:MAG: type II toxin-antitoxin system VapC family toxin [Sulfolobales archaeon]|nr:type II toxin-antitoxin system VapC family toxin [Sulfolobales archaeon]MCX8208434.1 type II toxin-antitoxin system VapC family toxin [Sulfolobales archaeon]MDW8010637.1 type II toxin-antitoxin system VapC family toxin [Sulfolobales archaeon]